jgi:stearoyl-CoA desaturase (delta-9 desaturase)
MDWILHPNPEFQSSVYLNKWVSDLLKQPFYRKRYVRWLPTVALALLCLFIGGFPAVLWGVALPVTVGLHQTWFVNSATHLWGKRRFNTPDNSRNLWWVALITWGEGWHNNHHHNPVSPRHGLAWYEIDTNWRIIKCLRGLKLVWETKD